MKKIWSWHKQLQLSALMDFENLIEKWTSELPVASLSDFLLSKYKLDTVKYILNTVNL